MLGLEKIIAGAKLRGIAGPSVVEVVRVEWIGSDALNVGHRGADGPGEVLLFRDSQHRQPTESRDVMNARSKNNITGAPASPVMFQLIATFQPNP
jgi:hypothetical protein